MKWSLALTRINKRLTEIVLSGKGKVEIHITPREPNTSVSMLAGERMDFDIERESVVEED